MRKIGEIQDAKQASLFSDALYVRGLENDVESEDSGAFSIWVHDDDRLAEGKSLFEKFIAAPEAPEWQSTASKAGALRKEEEKTAERRASNVITRERMDYERNFVGFAIVPAVLAVLSIVFTLLAGELGVMPSSWQPEGPSSEESSEESQANALTAQIRNKLLITEFRIPQDPEAFAKMVEAAMAAGGDPQKAALRYFVDPTLPEVRSGQVWRLFTPMFLHFGLIHLIFNLFWLRDLGSFLQHRFGVGYVLVLILAIAAVSNLVQLYWTGSPLFGGLSGVNYGLLGFMWMRGRFDRAGFWQINPQILQWMMIWFFLCFTPLIPNVANGAHAGGLLFGMLLGYTTAQISNIRRFRR